MKYMFICSKFLVKYFNLHINIKFHFKLKFYNNCIFEKFKAYLKIQKFLRKKIH